MHRLFHQHMDDCFWHRANWWLMTETGSISAISLVSQYPRMAS